MIVIRMPNDGVCPNEVVTQDAEGAAVCGCGTPWAFLLPFFCIVVIVIRMPNDGVCPIQVVTQDADMAENINFIG